MITGDQVTEALNRFDETDQAPEEWLQAEGIDKYSVEDAFAGYEENHPAIHTVSIYTIIMIGFRVGLYLGRKEADILVGNDGDSH